MQDQEERRMFERFMARFPVKFQHSREGFGTEVYLRDASAHGIMVTSRQRMFLQDSVSLVVELPNGFLPMKLTGRVVWAKKKNETFWDVGVEFHKTMFMGMQRMFQLVERKY